MCARTHVLVRAHAQIHTQHLRTHPYVHTTDTHAYSPPAHLTGSHLQHLHHPVPLRVAQHAPHAVACEVLGHGGHHPQACGPRQRREPGRVDETLHDAPHLVPAGKRAQCHRRACVQAAGMCPSCAGVRQEPDSTVCLSFCAPGLGNACMACSPGTEGVDGQATRWCNIGGARCVIRRTMPSLQRHAQSVVPRVVRGVGRYSVPVKRAPKVPPPSPAATPSNAIPVCAHPDAFRPHRPSLLLASDSVSPRTLPLAPAGATIRWIQGRRERHHAMEFRAGGQRHHAMEFRAGGQRHHASDSGQEGSAAMQWIQGGSAPAHAQHLQACPGWLRHSPTHMPPHTHTHTHTHTMPAPVLLLKW